MEISRNSFIISTAAALAVPSPAPAAAPAQPASFDRKAFEAIINKPYRHRQVFASTKLSGAAVLNYMRNSLRAYAEGFGEGPGTLHVVGVLYGGSIALALSSEMWQKYPIASTLAISYWGNSTFAANQHAGTMNPYAAEVQAVVAQGAHFFLCDNVLMNLSAAMSQPGINVPTISEIHADLASHVVDGAMIVPAGVAALNAAQEARFTFVQATML